MNRQPNEIDILELLPQRRPFVMVDRLNYCDERVAKTELTVTADNIFVEAGRLQPTGLLENIAQTCAARIGYQTLNCGDNVKIGVIGAVSNMTVVSCPAVGQRIDTCIEVQEEVFSMTLVHAQVQMGGELICEADMKIALTDKEATA